jgi:hypothetical protein
MVLVEKFLIKPPTKMRVLVRAESLGNISNKACDKVAVLVRADCFTGKYYLQACDNDTCSRSHFLFKSKIFLIELTTWCQIQPIIKKTHESWKEFSQSHQSWKEVLAIESALPKKQRCYRRKTHFGGIKFLTIA